MIRWDGSRPTRLVELFQFYTTYVKWLYSAVQSQNVLPVETLFELNAALDHLSEYWAYGVSETSVVADAFSHLKRSCLDIFKLRVKEAREQYEELSQIDISVIDNGDFKRDLNHLFAEIQRGASAARLKENQPDTDESVPAFELWEEVYINCEKLKHDFYLNKKVEWARRRGLRLSIQAHAVSFALGVAASLVAALLWQVFIAPG